MDEKEKMVGVLVKMPKSLKDDFQKVLAKNGSGMNAVIRILIAEYLEKYERLEEEKPKKVLKRKKKSGE